MVKNPNFHRKMAKFEVFQVSRQKVENRVNWVKKSTSRKSTQQQVCDVVEPEKHVFMAFWAVFEAVLKGVCEHFQFKKALLA